MSRTVNSAALGRPRPVPDELSRPYWEAAARGVLALPCCATCRRFVFPPDAVCPECGSVEPAYSYQLVGGTGRVRSWTVVHQSFLPGFDVPFVLVDVELDVQEGLRMVGRLVDGQRSALRVGDRVRVAFEDLGSGMAVPAFAREVPA